MKRTAFRILLAITLLAAVAPAWAAQDREPVPFEPFTLPAMPFCGFPIDVGLVSNKEFQDVTTLADGTTVTQIRGTLKLSFTANGITIVRNVSGPTTTIVHPDGTGTFIGEGENYFIFGPNSRDNTHEPPLSSPLDESSCSSPATS
jgi:hypothetical protein